MPSQSSTPALGNALQSTYDEYKSDTNFVASWLATSAVDNDIDIASHTEPATTARKGKGKVSKVLLLSGFEILAREIVNHDPPIAVPDHFILRLKRAINNRCEHAAMLKISQKPGCGQEEGLDAYVKAHKSHQHFVDILRLVHDLFVASRGLVVRHAMVGQLSDPAQLNNSQNKFSALEIEETVQTSGVRVECQDQQPDRRAPWVAPRTKSAEEECWIAFMMHLNELHAIRQEVIKTWVEYTEGKIHVVAAARATSTAQQISQDLVFRLEDNLQSILGRPVRLEAWLTAAFRHHFGHAEADNLHTHMDLNSLGQTATTEAMKEALYETYDRFMQPATMILPTICDKIKNSGHSGEAQEAKASQPTVRHNMSADEKLRDDTLQITKLVQDARRFHDAETGQKPGYRVVDEATTAVLEALDRRLGTPLPLDHAFVITLRLDIQRVLCESLDRGFTPLRRAAYFAIRSEHQMTVLMEKMPQVPWPRCRLIDGSGSAWIESLSWVSKGGAEFFRENAYMCGLTVHRLCESHHKQGIFIANCCRLLKDVVFLYHMLQSTGHLQVSWPDLEHAEKNQFFRFTKFHSNTKTIADFLTIYGTSVGSCPVDSERNSQTVHHSKSKKPKAHIPLRFLAPLSNALDSSVSSTGKHKTGVSIADLKSIFKKPSTTLAGGHSMQVQRPLPQDGLPLKDSDSTIDGAVKLIKKVRFGMNAEMPVIVFDYLRLSGSAWTVLRKLQAEFEGAIEATLEMHAMEPRPAGESSYPSLVVVGLLQLTMNRAVMESLLPRPLHAAGDATLARTARVLQEFIEARGSENLDAVRDDYGCTEKMAQYTLETV